VKARVKLKQQFVSLNERLEESFDELEISQDKRASLKNYLNMIKKKDKKTYEHSIRVGLKAIEVAKFVKILNPKALFYAGLLHDLGKCLTDSKSLKKKKGFNSKDRKELSKHPEDGYKMLNGSYDFSSKILLFHHYFGNKGYPHNFSSLKINLSDHSILNVLFYSRILALIDFYDAVSNRKNDSFSPGSPRTLSKEEAKTLLLENNSDQAHLIGELYNAGIF